MANREFFFTFGGGKPYRQSAAVASLKQSREVRLPLISLAS
jgi:hypothetical protein